MIGDIIENIMALALGYMLLVGMIGIVKYLLIDNTAWKSAAMIMASMIVLYGIVAAGTMLGL